jgi:glycosyltransferase involved in cell wall biosynthesis
LPSTEKEEVVAGARVYRIKSLIIRNLPAFLPPPYSVPLFFPHRFLRVCEKEKPDIIHLHNRFFLSFASVAVWKRFLNKPLFLTLHNAKTVGISEEIDRAGQLFDSLIGNRVMECADRIIANSKWTLEVTVPKGYPRERTEIIFNGVDTKKFRPVKTDLKSEFDCEFLSTTVCRLIPQKGVEYLIRAIDKIEDGFKAVIIGRGPELEKLQELASKLKVRERVIFVAPFIPLKKLIEYYSACDFFILPSLWEPFGIVLVEAMACGSPVISTRVGGIPEVVSDSGLLVEPRDPERIAEAVNKLIDDEKLRKKLSRKARKRAEKVFDFDIIAKRVEESYARFLGEG